MLIYTGGTGDPKKEEMLQKYDLGIMISSTPSIKSPRTYSKFKCALDNGAFACHRRGFPFQEDVFFKTISAAYKNGITLDFIVCPDIVCGGMESLEFSFWWARNKLRGTRNLALAVQDGMSTRLIEKDMSSLEDFSHIFIGGSKEWKWETAKSWKDFADKCGKKLHIGGVGTLDRLKQARDIGADSVDSTSFVRNESLHILDKFYENEEGLF